ncbi:MAG: hypothetical protein OWQ48_04110 [Desulfurococcus sp.]|nr:hypothetical protein [Desulfurococcus sp.]
MSDVDILVVIPSKPSFQQAVELREKIMEKAEQQGLPLYAPVELHIVGRENLEEYSKRGRIIPALSVFSNTSS